MNLDALILDAHKIKGYKDSLELSVKETKHEIHALEAEDLLLEKTLSVLRLFIDKEVSQGVNAVESILTDGLKTVFNDMDLSVKAQTEIQRGKVSVSLSTLQDHSDFQVEGSSPDAFGGSVVTLQSVLLRVVLLLRRNLRPLLLLDETLPAIDSNYTANLASFLSSLCKRIGMDILVITHNPTLFEMADRSYRVIRKNGESWFERVR
jgi:hypothetical protein